MGYPKPIELVKAKISKEKRAYRTEAEKAYKVSRLRLVPPDELSERAKMKFIEIANEAFWLDELSTDLLASYCVTWERMQMIIEELNGQGEVFITTDKDGTKHAKANPNRTAFLQYAVLLQQLSAKLAIGNIDRLKLSLPADNKKENKFEEYMSEVV